MSIPNEVQVVFNKPISCFGRVIPACCAVVLPTIIEHKDDSFVDIPTMVWWGVIIAVISAFFSGVSGWLSTASGDAREELKQTVDGSPVKPA